MDIEKFLDNSTIASYYFAELGKKLSPSAARNSFQKLVKSGAVDEKVLKIAKISYLSELQKEINDFLLEQVKEIKEGLVENIITQEMKDELDERLKMIDEGKAKFINYEDFRSEFLS